MATILFVREGAPPSNIASMREVPVHEVIEQFGEDSQGYVKRAYSDTPTINKESGPANPVASPQHVIVKIQNKDVVGNTFPEPGCYLVKNVTPIS